MKTTFQPLDNSALPPTAPAYWAVWTQTHGIDFPTNWDFFSRALTASPDAGKLYDLSAVAADRTHYTFAKEANGDALVGTLLPAPHEAMEAAITTSVVNQLSEAERDYAAFYFFWQAGNPAADATPPPFLLAALHTRIHARIKKGIISGLSDLNAHRMNALGDAFYTAANSHALALANTLLEMVNGRPTLGSRFPNLSAVLGAMNTALAHLADATPIYSPTATDAEFVASVLANRAPLVSWEINGATGGMVSVGETLTLVLATSRVRNGNAATIQWRHALNERVPGANIPGATSVRLPITQAMVGNNVQAVITGLQDENGNALPPYATELIAVRAAPSVAPVPGGGG